MYIRNVDPEQFANIRDKVFEVFEEMKVDLEKIMDQDSEKVLFEAYIDYVDALGGQSCINCRVPMYTIFPCSTCLLCTH